MIQLGTTFLLESSNIQAIQFVESFLNNYALGGNLDNSHFLNTNRIMQSHPRNIHLNLLNFLHRSSF